MRVGSRMPRLLLPLFLIVLPEQHVEAMQSLAECGNKLEGRLPKECGARPTPTRRSAPRTASRPAAARATTSNGSNAAPATLNELIERTEAIVSSIVAAAMPEVSNLCEYREGCSCSLKAVSNNLGDMVCVDGLGDADNCARDGRMLNLEESAVRIAPETPTPYSENYNGMICATQGLDTTFKAKFETDGDWLAWQYFGSDQGMFRSYPGGPRAEDDYDPRRRPWYTIAANGPKDVVLVVDTSGSMGENNRLGLTKDALKALIDSLAPTDRLGLVEFDASAQIFTPGTSSGFLEMTSAGKQQASAAIDGLRASGSTNFRAGLQTALEYFKRARDGGTSTYCESVIVFITDGRDTAIEDEQITKREMIEEVRGYYDALGTDYPQPNLFTLSMGDDADNAMPAMFACAFDGVWASVSDGQDPLSQLASFFAFFALSLTNEDRVVWADLYEDASGAGLVTTASQAVFREAGGALMGVVGVDVMLGSLKDVATQEQIESAIQARSQQCMGKLDDVECELQLVRSQSATPSECPAPADSDGGCVNVHEGLAFWAPPLADKKTRDDADNDCKSKGYDGLAVFANLDELAMWRRSPRRTARGWRSTTGASRATSTSSAPVWMRLRQNSDRRDRAEAVGFGEPNDYGDGEDCVFVDPRARTTTSTTRAARSCTTTFAGPNVRRRRCGRRRRCELREHRRHHRRRGRRGSGPRPPPHRRSRLLLQEEEAGGAAGGRGPADGGAGVGG